MELCPKILIKVRMSFYYCHLNLTIRKSTAILGPYMKNRIKIRIHLKASRKHFRIPCLYFIYHQDFIGIFKAIQFECPNICCRLAFCSSLTHMLICLRFSLHVVYTQNYAYHKHEWFNNFQFFSSFMFTLEIIPTKADIPYNDISLVIQVEYKF